MPPARVPTGAGIGPETQVPSSTGHRTCDPTLLRAGTVTAELRGPGSLVAFIAESVPFSLKVPSVQREALASLRGPALPTLLKPPGRRSCAFLPPSFSLLHPALAGPRRGFRAALPPDLCLYVSGPSPHFIISLKAWAICPSLGSYFNPSDFNEYVCKFNN